jgi:hypothetical protein
MEIGAPFPSPSVSLKIALRIMPERGPFPLTPVPSIDRVPAASNVNLWVAFPMFCTPITEPERSEISRARNSTLPERCPRALTRARFDREISPREATPP